MALSCKDMTLDELQPLAQRMIDMMVEQDITIKGKAFTLSPAICSVDAAEQLQEKLGVQIAYSAEFPANSFGLCDANILPAEAFIFDHRYEQQD